MPWNNGLPTYKNWGGPGWSAGKEVSPGTQLTAAELAVPGLDPLDELFKQHDLDYQEAAQLTDPYAEAKAILEADMRLFEQMGMLDPTLLDADGQRYRAAALGAFEDKILTWDIPSLINNGISTAVGSLFTSATTPPRRDPLAIDLDGDGIETVGANANNPILFDHNGDGIKTGTGWVKSDDGLLVMDRNGNGSIDTGSELFGADTTLSTGSKAADGFAALSDVDSNHDGAIDANDANDAQFADLKVWRDLNQDGVSQAGELFTLGDLGIASISIATTTATVNLGNGNTQTATSGFTRTDGTTGTVANLNLASDTFHREYVTPVAIGAAAALLRDMQGSGRVRDMREAANEGEWRVAA